MTWTTPRTWFTSQLVTAADLNTDIRDNLAHLYSRYNYAIAVDYANTSTSSTSAVQMTTASVTLTTIGKPVVLIAEVVSLRSTDTNQDSYYQWYNSTTATALGTEYRNRINLATPATLMSFEHPAAGTYTWYVRWRVNAGTFNAHCQGVRLLAIELM